MTTFCFWCVTSFLQVENGNLNNFQDHGLIILKFGGGENVYNLNSNS